LSRQVLRAQAFQERPSLNAWVALLRAHASLTRTLNAQLVQAHGLTINDYEVLLHLARADGHQLRRVDLAERLLLTASGITRLLDGLERAGYVCKGQCASDARVTYAVITDAGFAKLKAASGTHIDGIRGLFEERFSDGELDQLAELLARLTAAEALGASDCSVAD
jgi:DNA-binding MarR family transcriptional regulator